MFEGLRVSCLKRVGLQVEMFRGSGTIYGLGFQS